MDPKAKEILLFETENEGKKIISNNVQDIAEILETKKKPSIVLDSYDERAPLSFDKFDEEELFKLKDDIMTSDSNE